MFISAFICMVLGVHLGHRKYKITSFVRDDYVKFFDNVQDVGTMRNKVF